MGEERRAAGLLALPWRPAAGRGLRRRSFEATGRFPSSRSSEIEEKGHEGRPEEEEESGEAGGGDGGATEDSGVEQGGLVEGEDTQREQEEEEVEGGEGEESCCRCAEEQAVVGRREELEATFERVESDAAEDEEEGRQQVGGSFSIQRPCARISRFRDG